MMQLELLWNLQCIDKEINKIKKDLKDRELYNRMKEIKECYSKAKETLDLEMREIEQNDKKLVRLNVDLKHMEEKLKESDSKLYEEGSNVKVIESLQKEMETYKGRVDEIENVLLELMEQNEKLDRVASKRRQQILEYKDEFEKLKKIYTRNNEDSRRELDTLSSKREEIIGRIGESLISQYNDITQKKVSALSAVRDNTCTECGVKLNAVLYDRCKNKEEICKCDHCGRILYLNKEKRA